MIGFWTEFHLVPDSRQWWRFLEVWGLNLQSLPEGRFHSLLSYSLVHGNLGHLLTNVILLILFGHRLGRLVSTRSLITLAVGSVLFGGACQLFVNQYSPDLLLVGASPIAFAWGVAWMTLDPDARMLGMPFKLLAPAIVFASLALAIGSTLPSLTNSALSEIWRTSHASHFGGALVGYLWGILWTTRKPVTLEALQRQRASREP